ncbi:Bug family tripartite tricarboxylate transporter substrate binding protein [Roseomonas marmotae]|uniref:Tripartite tricarboxylate transporter substrate binding protein n=1 Tax=Roseomonas marmotae TaxID=2768161 RepID=A0ABS3K7N6_9PROT|nr:tripartite tricarboxylate transporter substrate binding protein [Roseomonas marmotae]MBO1073483.1 tripartite tricarboxylate transporter substrate binding protein [Roseomonas marmotae]QTI80325.1 tripartite tricarboxylate transporter substrate binding protein [Roseomonas marmotae]
MPLTRRHALAALSLPLAAALPGPARAQAPGAAGTITLIVPTAPAGTTDFAARLLAEPLTQELGQTVVVENRAGANGALGTGHVARARPDGLTLLVQYSGYHVGSPAVVPNLGYDVKRDFAPMALLMDSPQVVFCNPRLPAKTLAELIAHAKANPGKLNYASSGNGSMQHLGTELLKQRAGIDLVHVPYRGTGPVTQDLLAGRVELFMTTPPPLMPFVRDGSLRALAITSAERHPALPDVPTLAESGLPDLTIIAWFAVFAPAATPAPVLARLTQAIDKVVATPEFRRKAEEQGAVIRPMSPADLGRRVVAELDEWTRVVRSAGIQAE